MHVQAYSAPIYHFKTTTTVHDGTGFDYYNLDEVKFQKHDSQRTRSSNASKPVKSATKLVSKFRKKLPSLTVSIKKEQNLLKSLVLSPLRFFSALTNRVHFHKRNQHQYDSADAQAALSSSEDINANNIWIGQGGFGTVCKFLYNNREAVIKQLHHSRHSASSNFTSFCAELNAFRLTASPNVVTALSFSTEEAQLHVISEFVDGRNLRQLIDDEDWVISSASGILFALQIINGLMHCHDHLLLHLDLKPANILISRCAISCKLSDFGCSRRARRSDNDDFLLVCDNACDTSFGTIAYMAPELFMGCLVTDRADIYSYSVLLWELFTRSEPYGHDMHPHAVIYLVSSKQFRPPIDQLEFDHVDHRETLTNLITNGWSATISERPSAFAIHEILSRIMEAMKPN